MVLVPALRCGVTPARMRYLEERVAVSRRTVMRWRKWWREELIATAFWRAGSSRLMPPVEHRELPASLLAESRAGSTFSASADTIRLAV